MTNAREFTKKRRMTVELPTDGSQFVIRRIGVMDVLMAGGNPDLMAFLQSNGRSPQQRAKVFAERSKEMLQHVQKDARKQREFCEALMARGIVDPKIGEGDDMVNLADLTFEECDMLAGAILKFSGFTKEAAKTAAPLSRTESPSEISMNAPGATGESPPISPGQAASKPTASTSHAPGQDSKTTGEKTSA